MATTNSTPRITKRDRFNELLALAEVQSNEGLVKFIEHELELLDRKNTTTGEKKPTAKQVANEAVQADILESMEINKLYTVSELMKIVPALDGVSNQYASSQVRALVNAGSLVRTEEKRKAYFSLA